MGGGGGGTLNKFFPGYKDKIWARVPQQWKSHLVQRWNQSYANNHYKASVVLNQKLSNYHANVLERLRPSPTFANVSVDYKRQKARGTLVEGSDMYLPTQHEQQRLYRHFEPYSPEESARRSNYKFQDLRFYLAVALAFSIANGYLYQQRPVCWCLEKEPPHPPHYPFYFKSPTHSHDIASVRRGYEVYRQVCQACHSMEQLHFRHLSNAVYPELRAKQLAASIDVTDGPDDTGEMYTRPGLLGDKFPSPYPNEEAARYANGGAYPPDLSVISAARMGGPDYLMALLLGYQEPPQGVELRSGLYWNTWFPGNAISMPPQLEDDLMEYEDGTPCNVSQMAKDVVTFLTWATEPTHDERKLTTLKTASALGISVILMTIWYRAFWAVVATKRIDFGAIKHI